MKKYLIIAAGGTGVRMNTDIIKQFIILVYKPILMFTIDTFYKYDNSINIILALPENHIQLWKVLCIKHKFLIKHEIVVGGETRFHSIKNALEFVDNDSLVAIHDAVRPFVSIDTINNCFNKAESDGNAIPVIDVVESIRFADEKSNKPIDRTKIKIVQTPQVFHSNIIKKAYKKSKSSDFTDDASVLEALGHKINLVEGNKENIKITTPIDLLYGEVLLKNFKNQQNISSN